MIQYVFFTNPVLKVGDIMYGRREEYTNNAVIMQVLEATPQDTVCTWPKYVWKEQSIHVLQIVWIILSYILQSIYNCKTIIIGRVRIRSVSVPLLERAGVCARLAQRQDGWSKRQAFHSGHIDRGLGEYQWVLEYVLEELTNSCYCSGHYLLR